MYSKRSSDSSSNVHRYMMVDLVLIVSVPRRRLLIITEHLLKYGINVDDAASVTYFCSTDR